MESINKEWILGKENSVYLVDENKIIYVFEEDGSGHKRSHEGEIYDFSWKINNNGVLAIIYSTEEQIFWKIKTIVEDGLKYIIQEYVKSNNKPIPSKTFFIKRDFYDSIEEDIQESNISEIKSILKDYNAINLGVISSCFISFFILLYIILNNIVIVKDFSFLFQFIIMFIVSVFFVRPVWFLSHKLSYKIRKMIEK